MRSRSGWTTKATPDSSSSRGLKVLYKGYKRRCQRANTYFDLTLDEFNAITKKFCGYCERPPVQRQGSYLYNGIDRSDNSRGYTYDNSVPCCWECNRIKGATLTAAEMREIGSLLRELRKRKDPK